MRKTTFVNQPTIDKFNRVMALSGYHGYASEFGDGAYVANILNAYGTEDRRVVAAALQKALRRPASALDSVDEIDLQFAPEIK